MVGLPKQLNGASLSRVNPGNVGNLTRTTFPSFCLGNTLPISFDASSCPVSTVDVCRVLITDIYWDGCKDRLSKSVICHNELDPGSDLAIRRSVAVDRISISYDGNTLAVDTGCNSAAFRALMVLEIHPSLRCFKA